MLNKIGNFLRKRTTTYIIMLMPAVIILFIYAYIPLGGLAIAFQKFIPAKGLFGKQQWVGVDNFKYLFSMPNSMQVIRNTFIISFLKLITIAIFPVVLAVLINEVKLTSLKKLIQTSVYMPHFISWVIISAILVDILSPSTGIINKLLSAFGVESIFFLGNNKWFVPTLVVSELWKECGFSSVVYLAAITGINHELYESATVDGANRWKQAIYITIPCISGTIVLMTFLKLGNILDAGFEQVFNLYNSQVYETGDILDTFIYRIGIVNFQYSLAAAAGFFKSVVSLFFVSVSYWAAYKFADYKIF
ncbi:MAG TPA: sugar ABC transporter permease [Clostridiaceae bacterium]|nr:sugar ABC transporter permease [Clostridiaceae bacterium]